MNPQVHAYILAGGRSSRFGSDKARANVDGQPLIARLAKALAPHCVSQTVVAQCVDAYQDLGLRTVADHEAHHGPLAGLLRALEDLIEMTGAASTVSGSERGQPNAWALLLSCDLVQWEPAWLVTLLSRSRQDKSAIAFRTDRWQPFPGLYHPRLADTIRSRAQRGDGSMHGLLDDPDTHSIPVELGELPKIRCVNTLEEFRGWQSIQKAD